LDVESTRSDPYEVEVANVCLVWVVGCKWVLVRIQAWQDVLEVRHIVIVLVAVVAEHIAVPWVIVIFDLEGVSAGRLGPA
jgi:hypothetical protein